MRTARVDGHPSFFPSLALGKQPFHEFSLPPRHVVGLVLDPRVEGDFGHRATGLFDGVDHVRRAAGRHDIVLRAVEGPDGKRDQGGGFAGIAGTTDGHSGGKQAGIANDHVPRHTRPWSSQ